MTPAPICTGDFEALARARTEGPVWDFLEGGSESEVTLAANTAAFRRIALRPRVLTGIESCDLSLTVLGTPLRFPVMVAPIGYQMLFHPEGERAMARAAAGAGTLMVVSTMANCTLEDIAQSCAGPLWFQLYVMKDRGLTASIVERAHEARYRAIVVTVDAPRLGRRERDLRNGFSLPGHLRAANLTRAEQGVPGREAGVSGIAAHADACFDPSVDWRTLEWLRTQSRLPLVVKGILDGEDARRAVDAGADGIVVSNHGGRQLDGAPATLDVLPEVVNAVQGKCEIYLDGGIRRGTDVLKARALGAHAVFVGRPAVWGLMVDGERGACNVLGLLRDEIHTAMHLCGRGSWAAIDASLVRSLEGES